MFTDGIPCEYESIMKKPPNVQNVGGGKRSARFKYTFSDISCKFCLNNHIKRVGCGIRACPYIMDNLDDLIDDTDFINAVKNAEICTTKQKETLLMLKRADEFLIETINERKNNL
ncbi:MAG: hypothetical protein FWG87_00335 [Defluviitaleaceae bacterium]|nr:hypothetical protein [Defluviitaleaceae bacterium]